MGGQRLRGFIPLRYAYTCTTSKVLATKRKIKESKYVTIPTILHGVQIWDPRLDA